MTISEISESFNKTNSDFEKMNKKFNSLIQKIDKLNSIIEEITISNNTHFEEIKNKIKLK